MDFSHRSVMPAEVAHYLGCSRAGVFVDGTLGGGGHAYGILEANPENRLIGIDKDEDALRAAEERLRPFAGRYTLVREDFRNMGQAVHGLGVDKVDGVLLDLGVSSFQLESPERGFSFRADAPLDMRMDNRQALTARDIVNGAEAAELESIFREYGEEEHARRIVRAIEAARSKRPIETTGELALIVSLAIPKKFHGKKIHPATKVFQALRIEVNDELGAVKEGLASGMGLLKKGGRMAVISFHSLEDRMVKNAFREAATGCVCPPRFPQCVCGQTPRARLLTRKAAVPSPEEIEENPRSRSAKLRAIEML